MSMLIKNATGYAAAFQATDITSDKMRKAIPRWVELYYQEEATEQEDPCQQIPYTIVRKLTKAIFPEYSTRSENKYADSILLQLDRKATEAMQMALICGECALKPIPAKDGFQFMVVPRYNMLVFARDPDGRMTDVGMAEMVTQGNCYYTLLERRTVSNEGYLSIRYRLFKSYNKENLGTEVPLGTVPQYSDLAPEYTFTTPVNSLGLIPLKTPMANCIDGSADSVSVYAAAETLIRNINRNEALLSGEFERAQSRVIASRDMIKNGALQDHLFVGLDEDPETVGITIYNPNIREASFLARKQEYLRNVENVIGLKRGLLSEVEAAERTATEITSSAGDYNLTVIEFQEAWEKAIRETMRVCSVLGQLYKITNACEIKEEDVAVSWGNGVLYDEGKTWEEYKDLVAKGLLKPEIAVAWYFDMPYETEEDLKKVRERLMPAMLEEDE